MVNLDLVLRRAMNNRQHHYRQQLVDKRSCSQLTASKNILKTGDRWERLDIPMFRELCRILHLCMTKHDTAVAASVKIVNTDPQKKFGYMSSSLTFSRCEDKSRRTDSTTPTAHH